MVLGSNLSHELGVHLSTSANAIHSTNLSQNLDDIEFGTEFKNGNIGTLLAWHNYSIYVSMACYQYAMLTYLLIAWHGDLSEIQN